MASGGEIKVVLTMDDDGFSVKTRKAQELTDALNKTFKDAGKSSKGVESDIRSLGKSLESTVSEVNAFNKGIGSFTEMFSAMREDLGAVIKEISGLSNAMRGMSNTGAARSVRAITDETRKYKEALASLKPSLNEAIQGQERLSSASKKSAQEQKITNDQRIKNEIEANERILADKRKFAAAMIEQENRLRIQAEQHRIEANRIERRLGPYAGKNKIAEEVGQANRLDANADIAKSQLQSTNALIESIGIKNNLLREEGRIAAENAAKYAEMDRIHRDSMKYLTKGYNDRIAAARHAGQVEREELNSTASLMRGMAQLWSAAKIEGFLKSSIGTVDDYQRQVTELKSLNLSPAENKHAIDSSWADAAKLQFVSPTDVLRARLAGIGGLGYNNQPLIDALQNKAITAAHNIGYITGDKSGNGMNDMIRNIYGVIESRGQTSDLNAASKTIDLIQRIYSATGGKITIADLEMVLKRDGQAANKLSDQGIAKLVALMDAAKTSGIHGGGGSAGAGVSMVGTAVSMFQKMANGGLMTVQAAKMFKDAGLLDPNGYDPKFAGSVMKALRQSGLSIGPQSNKDPVGALESMSGAILKYMEDPKNRKKFFGDKSINDPEAVQSAFGKFGNSLGWSTTAVRLLQMMSDPRIMERAKHQQQTIDNSKDVNGMAKDVNGTLGTSIDKFNKQIETLKTTVGSAASGPFKALIDSVNQLLGEFNKFAKNNPVETQMALIGVAAAGAVLAFKGFKNTFGVISSLSEIVKALRGSTDAAAASTGGLSLAMTEVDEKSLLFGQAIRTKALAALISFNGEGGVRGTLRGMRLLGSAVTDLGRVVGKAFMRMIPLVGELLLAWDFANVIANLEVGGVKIKTWAANLMDWLATKIANGWDHIKDIFTLGMNYAEYEKKIAERDLAHRNAAAANGITSTAGLSGTPQSRLLASMTAKAGKVSNGGILGSDLDLLGLAPHKQAPHVTQTAKTYVNRDKGLGGDSKHKKSYEDLFTQAYGNLRNSNRTLEAKINSLLSGKTRDYSTEAQDYVLQQLMSGEYDKGHNPENRKQFLKKGYSFNPDTGQYMLGKKAVDASQAVNFNAVGDNGKTLSDMAKEKEAILKNTDAYNALSFAKQRLSAASDAANKALESLANGGLAKESRAMSAMRAEFARAKARNPSGVDNSKFDQMEQESLQLQAIKDGSDMVSSLKLEHAAKNNKNGSYAFSSALQKKYAQYSGVTSELNDQLKTATPGSDNYTNLIRIRKEITDQYVLSVKDMIKAQQDAAQTPLQKLGNDWLDAKGAIKSQETGWANSFLSAIENGVSTGHFKNGLKNAFAGVLTDVRNDIIKQLVEAPIMAMVSQIGVGATGLVGATAPGGAGIAGSLGGSFLGPLIGGLGNLFSGTSFGAAMQYNSGFGTQQSQMLAAQDAGLNGGSSSGFGGAIGSVLGGFLGHLFANGGVMTPFGSASLRKYANGGIANSPQIAIYGEGSMNEAYVPLPDGRSIPVTMNGQNVTQNTSSKSDGGNNVTISVVVNGASGATQSQTATGPENNVWAGMTSKIKQIVLQELAAQQRPGGTLQSTTPSGKVAR